VQPLSAFLRCHGEESSSFLVHLLATALGTFDVALLIFRERNDRFEGLIAIFAIELVAWHSVLQEKREACGSTQAYTLASRDCQGAAETDSRNFPQSGGIQFLKDNRVRLTEGFVLSTARSL